MAYFIEISECIGCGACQEVCPVDCISVIHDDKRYINEEQCIDCGSCAEICPVSCIEQLD